MINLSQFLNFNKNCPLCDNPLTLYMQWVYFSPFKGQLIEEQTYDFVSFNPLNDVEPDGQADDHIILTNNFRLKFDNSALFNNCKKYQMYLFYLCNDRGFKPKYSGSSDYEINVVRGCYYRSTPFMELKKNILDKKWRLSYTNHKESIVNRDECFSIERHINGLDKVYVLDMNYENKETTLFHYTCTLEQRQDPKYRPKIFEKKLPLLNKQVSLKDKEKLMNRFDSWVIMS